MTTKPPRYVDPGTAPDHRRKRTRARSTDRTASDQAADTAGLSKPTPMKATALAGKATPVKKTRPANRTKRSEEVVLRSGSRPFDQLDFDDRHDTRATQSTAMSRRYAVLRKDRRKDDWHGLGMGLVTLVVGVACYLAGFIVVSLLLPHLSPWLVAQIVGLAYAAAGGGVVVRWAGRALKQRHHRRRGSSST